MMQKMKLRLRNILIPILILSNACGFHAYAPDLSNKERTIIESVEESVRGGMYIGDVEAVLREQNIMYSKNMPEMFSGGYLEEKYGDEYGIYIEVAPVERAGCWDEVLMIIKINADQIVDRIIKEFVNICT